MTDKNINQIEDELKRVLSRREAPPELAERVLARFTGPSSIRQNSGNAWWSIFTQPILRWTAITATAASLVIGGIHYRAMQRERARGEAAKQQLMLALRIAGSKLQLAKARVNGINASQTLNRSRSQEE